MPKRKKIVDEVETEEEFEEAPARPSRVAMVAHITAAIKEAKHQREADGTVETNEERLVREDKEFKDLKTANEWV